LRRTSRRLDHLGALAEDVRVDYRVTRDVVDRRALVLDLKADLRAGEQAATSPMMEPCASSRRKKRSLSNWRVEEKIVSSMKGERCDLERLTTRMSQRSILAGKWN
jgi:hypothetical protein